MMSIISLFKKWRTYFQQLSHNDSFKPTYRVLGIQQDENKDYIVHIQMINKNLCFHIKPEEILAVDNMVDMFSPRDVRTLTYLGYLGMNEPKYKILAQRMLEDGITIFAIKQKGVKDVIIKTAKEIIQEQEIISSMPSCDAHVVGYTEATEQIQIENRAKKELLH